jgi:hypothetical protein
VTQVVEIGLALEHLADLVVGEHREDTVRAELERAYREHGFEWILPPLLSSHP